MNDLETNLQKFFKKKEIINNLVTKAYIELDKYEKEAYYGDLRFSIRDMKNFGKVILFTLFPYTKDIINFYKKLGDYKIEELNEGNFIISVKDSLLNEGINNE